SGRSLPARSLRCHLLGVLLVPPAPFLLTPGPLPTADHQRGGRPVLPAGQLAAAAARRALLALAAGCAGEHLPVLAQGGRVSRVSWGGGGGGGAAVTPPAHTWGFLPSPRLPSWELHHHRCFRTGVGACSPRSHVAASSPFPCSGWFCLTSEALGVEGGGRKQKAQHSGWGWGYSWGLRGGHLIPCTLPPRGCCRCRAGCCGCAAAFPSLLGHSSHFLPPPGSICSEAPLCSAPSRGTALPGQPPTPAVTAGAAHRAWQGAGRACTARGPCAAAPAPDAALSAPSHAGRSPRRAEPPWPSGSSRRWASRAARSPCSCPWSPTRPRTVPAWRRTRPASPGRASTATCRVSGGSNRRTPGGRWRAEPPQPPVLTLVPLLAAAGACPRLTPPPSVAPDVPLGLPPHGLWSRHILQQTLMDEGLRLARLVSHERVGRLSPCLPGKPPGPGEPLGAVGGGSG
uniref:Uncharacterized protein n=1 Tax=Anas platyrhynchos platyrhynchos TaxID=8840 RepID=A0A493SV75_ANAPP